MTHKSESRLDGSPVSGKKEKSSLLFSKHTLIILLFTCLVGFALLGTASADTIFHINGGTWAPGATPHSPGVSGVSGDTFVVDAAAKPTFHWPDFADLNYEALGSHLNAPAGAKFLGWHKDDGTTLRVTPSGYRVVDSILTNEAGGLHAVNDLVDSTANEDYYAIWGYSFYANPNSGLLNLSSSPSYFIGHFQYGDNRTAEEYTARIPSQYYTHPDAPWTLEGWYDTRTGVNSSMAYGKKWGTSAYPIPVTSNITVYGNWSGNITFDANGGTFATPPGATTHKMPITPATTTADVIAYATPPGGPLPALNPLADGWAFDGKWYTKVDSNNVVDSSSQFTSLSTMLEPGKVLYARPSKTITAYANGPQFGHSPTPSDSVSINVQYNQSVSDIEDVIAAYGYTVPTTSGTWDWNFGGWYTANNSNGTVNIGSEMNQYDSLGTALGSATKIYMGWTRTITLDANGGTFGGVQNDFDVYVQPGQTYGDLKNLIAAELSLYGNPVNGAWTPEMWYTDLISGTTVDTTTFTDLSLLPATNVNIICPSASGRTLYVGWFGDITLDANGGTFPDALGPSSPAATYKVEVQPGQTYGDISALLTAALTAIGTPNPASGAWSPEYWYVNSDSTTKVVDTLWAAADPLVAGDTLYVGWFGDINLDANGGSAFASSTFGVQPGQTYNDIKTALNTIAATSTYGSWTGTGWYTTFSSPGIVDIGSKVIDTDTFNIGDTLYLGWFSNINLDANGGSAFVPSTFEVQLGQTYGDVKTALDAIVTTSTYGSWTADGWYKTLSAAEWVDTSSKVVSTYTFTAGDTLYLGWFGDITLDANGGTFPDALGPSSPAATYNVEVQPGQTYGDIESASLAAALTTIGTPGNGAWAPKYWYVNSNPTTKVVDTPWVAADSLAVGDIFYVGWFSDIILNANGGEFLDVDGLGTPGATYNVEVQAGQTYGDISVPSTGLLDTTVVAIGTPTHTTGTGWTEAYWYVNSDSITKVVDTLWVAADPLAAGDTLYVGWFGSAFFDPAPGVFDPAVPVTAGVYEMTDIQPGEDVSGLVPLATQSGYTLVGWINSSSLPWNFHFDDAGETLTADWKLNSKGGSSTGSAKIVGGSVSTPPVTETPQYIPSEPVIDNGSDNSTPKNDTPNIPDNTGTPDKRSNRTLYIVLAIVIILVVVVAGVYYFRVMKK